MKGPLITISLLLTSSCATSPAPNISCTSWDALFENPKAHAGEKVALYGNLRAEFEVCSLTAMNGEHDVWIAPSTRSGDLCSLEQATQRPITGKTAVVIGYFNYGENYGHLGAYQAALGNADVLINRSACIDSRKKN